LSKKNDEFNQKKDTTHLFRIRLESSIFPSQGGMIQPCKIGSLRPIWCMLSHNGIERDSKEGHIEGDS